MSLATPSVRPPVSLVLPPLSVLSLPLPLPLLELLPLLSTSSRRTNSLLGTVANAGSADTNLHSYVPPSPSMN